MLELTRVQNADQKLKHPASGAANVLEQVSLVRAERRVYRVLEQKIGHAHHYRQRIFEFVCGELQQSFALTYQGCLPLERNFQLHLVQGYLREFP